MADLCNAMGATCVITLNIKDTYPDYPGHTITDTSTEVEEEEDGDDEQPGVAKYLAELVEYMYGDASSVWGKQRIADGHPNAYNVTHFELGNEGYNPGFAEQVAAMEARAKQVRARGEWVRMRAEWKRMRAGVGAGVNGWSE